jgi:hypothetical protein
MKRLSSLAAAVIVAASLTVAPIAGSADAPPGQAAKLVKAGTLSGLKSHEQALQAIATANGGTRSAGTPGFDASVDYVVSKLEAAGYDPQVQTFDFPFFQELAPAVFDQV